LKSRAAPLASEGKSEVSILHRSRIYLRKRIEPKAVSALEDPDFVEWLESLNKRATEPKVAKKTTKQSAKKRVIKKPVKGVASKSTATKKISTKKAAPKKKATKKAATKKR
jgi:hypothetical protein